MLCHEEILEEMKLGNIVIEPFKSKYVNANSVDVCLGNWFISLVAYGGEASYGDLYYAPDGVLFPIMPYTTTLGMTKEVVGAYKHIVHQLRSKSSTRRKGITVCDDAGFGDIGYCNHWTVELTAHINALVTLKVGEPFGQIVFDRTGMDTEFSYNGQYNENDWPLCMIPSKKRKTYKPFFDTALEYIKETQPESSIHFRMREFNYLTTPGYDKSSLWVEPYFI